MIKPIITLIRIGDSYTYVSRSFDRLDDEAIAIIKGCITEDNELSLTPKEIEKCYLLNLNDLKKDYGNLHETPGKDFDLNHDGTPIWEYNDGDEVFTYVLHESLLTIPDSASPKKRYVLVEWPESQDFLPGGDLNSKEVRPVAGEYCCFVPEDIYDKISKKKSF